MVERSVSEIKTGAGFSAPIAYIQPSFEELRRRFPAYVNQNFKGKRLDLSERCKTVLTSVRERAEVAFEYVHMKLYATTDEVLAEMDRNRFRPAIYEELLSFAEKYPDEQRRFHIIALGSEMYVGGDRGVALLYGGGLGRGLDLGWISSDWGNRDRFLAVRLDSP